MRLFNYVVAFFTLAVFISAVVIMQNFQKEKQLFIKYNAKIKKIVDNGLINLPIVDKIIKKDTTIMRYVVPGSRIYINTYEYLGGMTLNYFESVKQNYFVSGKLIITEIKINERRYLKREYYRPNSTLFASTWQLFGGLGSTVTYYEKKDKILGEESDINIPPYLIYVLY